ncbi:MAG: hypothetical protein LUQ28_13985 [Methylococcaceae bacterium]|nr:hypothetical protein [Methylococcaceae bacterium]
MVQMENTINRGDGLHDVADRKICKQKVEKVWNGAKESDLEVKPEDHKISLKTGEKVFGMPVSGTIRLAWRFANIYDGKNASLDNFPVVDVDWLIHFRPHNDGVVALAIPRENIMEYIRKYGREIFKKKSLTTQIQLNTPAEKLPNVGSKKWNELTALVKYIAPADKLFNKVEDVVSKVNEVGRNDASNNSSNPRNNERKIGLPYKER